MVKVFLVDDHEVVRRGLADLLASDPELEVIGDAGSVSEAMVRIPAARPDVAVLDVRLPDGNGISLIHESRSAGHSTPILVITARAGVDDRIAGLDSGADDYLVKPFSHLELLARLRAILRRPRDLRRRALQVGHLVLDETTSEVRVHGQMLDLRAGERRLLALLMRQAGRIVPKSSIEERFSEFGRELSAILAYGISIVGVVCALAITGPDQGWLLWLHACFFGLTWGARGPAITAKTADLFPGPQLGTILGVITIGSGIGSAAGSWAVGWIFDHSGSYRLAFMLSIAAYPLRLRRVLGFATAAGATRC